MYCHVLSSFGFVIVGFLRADLKHVIRNVCIPYTSIWGFIQSRRKSGIVTVTRQLMGTFLYIQVPASRLGHKL